MASHADKSVFPGLLIGMVLCFFGVQNRIDRNDPKLGLAPVFADPDLTFAPATHQAMSTNHKIPSAEVVPLADRMRYMQGFRFSLVPVVALVVWLSRDALQASLGALAWCRPPTS